MEIERRFLVSELPDYKNCSHEEITQGYLVNENQTEVRIRVVRGKLKNDEYFQTTKIGSGIERAELEIPIAKTQFDVFWPLTEGKRLMKTRYYLQQETSKIQLNALHGGLEGNFLVEVEFSSRDAADNFIPPDWFGREVTDNPAYSGKNLAVFGWPKRKESEIPEYDLESGLRALIDLVKNKVAKLSARESCVVLVAGGNASGKTSQVAKRLKEEFPGEAEILSMDDYYRGATFMKEIESERGIKLNWDQPEAVNIELIGLHLLELKAGLTVQKPIYSFKTGEPTGNEEFKPHKVIIVEGLFALHRFLKDIGDVRVFVDIGLHGRILRRLLRDVERIGWKPADILAYSAEIIEPMHEKHVQSTKISADIVIRNEYDPRVEAGRSGLHELQLKFRGTLDDEFLRKIGAESLGSVSQRDVYYNPKDRNLALTGEIFRIRHESGRILLTYKGPLMDSRFRERPKFEFEISQETENKLLPLYGSAVKTISKTRSLYEFKGIVFSLDHVMRVEKDDIVSLGNFIELRGTGKSDQEKLFVTISILGLDYKNCLRESYAEM